MQYPGTGGIPLATRYLSLRRSRNAWILLEFILLVIQNIHIFKWPEECIARVYPVSYFEHTYLRVVR